MCYKKNSLLVNIILLTAILAFATSSLAADPVELDNLRKAFSVEKQTVTDEAQRKEVINRYIQQLTDLATDLRIYKNDREGTNAVRHEIRNARKELDANPADQAVPENPTPVAKPEPLAIGAAQQPEAVIEKPAPLPVASQPAMVEELIVRKPAPAPVAAKPEPQPPKAEPAPVEAEIATKAVPQPVVREPATMPRMVEAKPAPTPAVAPTPAPKPIMPATAPEPAVEKSAPQPVAPKPAPAAVVAKTTPLPVVPKPAPKPVVEKPTPPPVAPKPAPEKVVAKPAPKPVAAKPAPKPVAEKPEIKKEHIPQTYISSVEGLAGKPELAKNNIYEFDLPEIGSSTQIAFWATGKNSLDSYGEVWLVTPEGRRSFIRIWKESNFKQPASEISSFYMLKPFTDDITKKVSGPGLYKVHFEWTGGKDPLVIFRVEITS